MLNKIISIFLIIPALCGLYKSDNKDTEESYRTNIEQIAFENTIETANPQTDLYNIISDHFNSALPDGKTEKKAIIIGYDGCRADALNLIIKDYSGIQKLVDNGASVRLSYCGGINYPAENIQATSTAPGWCSILTGVWADKTGITGNGITKSLEYKTLLTTLTEDKIIDKASFTTSWNGHFINEDSTYKLEKQYCEDNSINVAFNYCSSDTQSANTTLKDIKSDDCSDFLFTILEGPDHSGHTFGFSTNNPIYKIGFQLNELQSLSILNAIENRDTYASEDWLIIITSDHGGYGTGHGGASIQERMTFFVCNK
ncbi:MAG: alkaline phosphatase family protein [Clostridia bacterium]|nr:alkaline phosphatase family protein [Clostridia bacterium]